MTDRQAWYEAMANREWKEKTLTGEELEAWRKYWRGTGPRPVPLDHEAIKRVVKQIQES